MKSGARANRLSGETSPYLLQHAHNPVDWSPWGPEALTRAQREDRPIFLSIGYAACHWCHVMERESFESEAIARVLNEHFVCIKVDREERPDIDEIYMAATVAMTGHGGWPMSVFLTPEGEPFFAGTYFPPDDRHGRPGFRSLLLQIAEAWKESRDSLREQAKELAENVRGNSQVLPGADIGVSVFDTALRQLSGSFDEDHGGFGGAPKFPPCGSLSLLLRIHRRRPSARALEMVTRTLDAMKSGGIYDHVGGGFARYSVDAEWLVPHFEKMLYDNAQLVRVYLEAYQVTGNEEYRRVVTETLDYVVREMQGPGGGYFSATDADSEGVEGKFFVWGIDELDELLGADAEAVAAYYGVTAKGNFEGANILHTPRALEVVARDLGTSPVELAEAVKRAKVTLHEARSRRVPPLTDDKVLVSWNGLMIGAMAEASRVLAEPKYLDSARRAAAYLATRLRRPDGGLYRTSRGDKAHLDAYLEDYAFLADALLDLHEASGDRSFLEEARRLAERLIQDFGDPQGGPFFHTAHGHEVLIARPREGHDGAIPSANAVAARALARLSFILDRPELRERAQAAVAAYGKPIGRMPRAFSTALAVVDLLLEGPIELAFAGELGSEGLEALRRQVGRRYLPNRVIGYSSGGAAELPLTAGKGLVGGKAALYVCRNYTCLAPVTRPEEVASRLADTTASLREATRSRIGEARLAGAATAVDTAAYASRFPFASSGYVRLGRTDLTVSRLGFGTYRVDDRVPAHREALRHALERGVNLIDTSTNYGDGHSEILVGEVLRELARASGPPRSAVVVVSKVGYVQGENHDVAQEREATGKPFPEMVKIGEGLWHCIHPEWLEDQLGRSLGRLGVEMLDVCLLHNPEYFLGHAERERMPLSEARAEFYRRVTEAFRHFESEVRRGRIAYYGVSSNSVAAASRDPEATNVEEFLKAARIAGGEDHHFRVLQLPMNLLEPGALLEKNTGASGQETVLDFARRQGIAVLANRPLNGIVDGRLTRLADPKDPGPAPPFAEALGRVRALETDFARAIAPSLQMEGGDPKRLFRWADALGRAGADIESLEAWKDMEQRSIAPRIFRTVEALEHGIKGPLKPKWDRFRDEYLSAIEDLFAALRSRAADRSRRGARALSDAIDPVLPALRRTAPLSQKALHAVASAPGMTSVLVGMRTADYVEDALSVLSLPLLDEAMAVFGAIAKP